MQEIGENRLVKPYFGYYPPDPNCPKCKGTGRTNVKISFEADQVWLGICSICGEGNGMYFQHYNVNPEEPDEFFREKIKCKNESCPNEFVSWIREEEVEG